MAETVYISGDPSQSTSWSNGVPTLDLDAVLDATSGSMSMLNALECRKLSVIGYTGTLNTNGFSVKIGEGGFDSGTTVISGSINWNTSDIECNGPVEFRGTSYTNMISQSANWTQKGGSIDAPNSWFMRRINYTEGLRFASLTFAQGSFTRFGDNTNQYYFRAPLVINGNLSAMTVMTVTNNSSPTTFGESGSINQSHLTFRQYVSRFDGTILSDGLRISALEIYSSTLAASGMIDSNVIFTAENSGTEGCTVTGAVQLNKTATFVCPATNDITHNASGLDLMGDVVFQQNGTGVLTISGEVKLTGTNDQNVIGNASTVIPIAAQKTAGNVAINGGDFSLTGDSDFGGELSFASGYAGTFETNGYSVAMRGFSAPNMITGTIDLGASTITNNGNVDWNGLTTTNFIAKNAMWIQQGGLKDTPHLWNTSSTIIHKIKALKFDADSYTRSNYLRAIECNLDILGDCRFDVTVYVTKSNVDISITANIHGNGQLQFVNCIISGTFENVTNPVYIREGTTAPGSIYNCPITIYSYTGVAATTILQPGAIFRNAVELQNDYIGNLTVNVNNATFCSDVIAYKRSTGNININGNIKLAESVNQSVDFGVVESTVGLSAEKTAGNVTIAGGNFALADEFTIENEGTPSGSLTLAGTASLVSGEYAVTVADFDSLQTTGEVTIGNLTVSGDVAAGASTVIDGVTLVGGNDQNIDFALVENVPELVFNKFDSGNTVVQVSDSGNIEDLKLTTKGTGGDAYVAGTGTVRLSDDLTLRFLTKDETILFDKNEHELKHTVLTSTFSDHFYSATKNVYSLGINFYGSTNPQVIQNAENV